MGFLARLASRPNEPHVDGFITRWLPDGRSARLAHASAVAVPEVGRPAAACLRAERVTPLTIWRLHGSGRSDEVCAVSLALTCRALTPPTGVSARAQGPGGGRCRGLGFFGPRPL